MNHEASSTAMDISKVALAWAGAIIGTISLQQIVLGLTAVYTLLQIYVVVKDKVLKGRGDDDEL